MTERTVRPLGGPEEEAGLKKTLLQCFEFPAERWEKWRDSVGRENLRVVLEGDRVLGGLGALPEGQWFGGRLVASAAIVAVGVAPEHRYSGAARDLLVAVLREMRERGFPLSVLFASTQRVYQRVGYEVAGNRVRYQAPVRGLPRGPFELEVTRLEGDDLEPLKAAHERRAKIGAGHLRRTPPLWERLLGRGSVYAYLFGPREAPEGFVLFAQENRGSDADLDVKDMAALTPRAARTLWRFLAVHASRARVVSWEGPATEPLALLWPENEAKPIFNERWMLRVSDPGAALEARGYAPAVSGRLRLEVHDDLLVENSGSYELEVEAGRGAAARGGASAGGDAAIPTVRVDARGLAPLYSGYLPARCLRDCGWIEADDGAVAEAERLFAGPEPWMPDDF